MTQAIHRALRMGGRDPEERHRAATPLELLFDLTFVVAFGTAANGLAHLLVEDHVAEGLIGFLFATFAISWAWIQYSWFASAYDTDDWIFRLSTMLQMIGVLILALGLPAMFESLVEGETIDNSVMVAGYIVMRVAMVAQWARAAKHDPSRRPTITTYITTIVVAQIGWTLLLFAQLPGRSALLAALPLALIELSGPVLGERKNGGTPWHAHHIAERYGLLVIVALGEGMIGTMAAMSALVAPGGPGYSVDFVLVLFAGVALTFGIWWVYFVLPFGDLLYAHRERPFGWGYGHIPIFGAIVAVGAGLHAAAFYLEGHTALNATGTALTVAIPVSIVTLSLYFMYSAVARTFDRFHVLLVVITAAVIAGSVALAPTSLAWSLVLLSVAPWVTVIGYEAHGYKHGQTVLDRLVSAS